MILLELTRAVSAAAPIHGISVGRKDDKATWRVDFAPEATDEQKAQAAQIVAAFDVDGAEHNDAIDAQIKILESTVTDRRKREAILSDSGRAWLAALDYQIAQLRVQRK